MKRKAEGKTQMGIHQDEDTGPEEHLERRDLGREDIKIGECMIWGAKEGAWKLPPPPPPRENVIWGKI
jgi:hypothetical protein